MEERKKMIGKSRKRSLKYGSFSFALIVVVVSVIVVLNLLVGKLDLKLDLTDQKVFTLSQETKDILHNLEEEVKITILERAGADATVTSRIIEKYGNETKNIKVEFLDPELNPGEVAQYTKQNTLAFGSLIIESEGKATTLNAIQLVGLTQSRDKVKENRTESEVTNAILKVTSKGEKKILTLQGHEETALGDEVTKVLSNENFKIEEFNLLTDALEPEANQILLMNSLKKDLSPEEKTKLQNYIDAKGKILVLDDLYDADRSNYYSILQENGLTIDQAIVFEDKQSHRLNSDKFIQIPAMEKHTIVDLLAEKNNKVVLAYAQPIEILHVKKDYLIVEPLLTSSEESYSKASKVIKEKRTTTQEKTDNTGPFTLGTAVSRRIDGENYPSMVVYSNGFFLRDDLNTSSNGANIDLFMNSLHWLLNEEAEMIVRPKDVTSSPVTMNNSQQIIISAIAIVVIPLVIGLTGFYYWYRRQRVEG